MKLNEKKIVKYVVTNPDKETRLEPTDFLFVLALMDPGDPEQWDIFNQTKTQMFDKNQNKKIMEINEMGLKS